MEIEKKISEKELDVLLDAFLSGPDNSAVDLLPPEYDKKPVEDLHLSEEINEPGKDVQQNVNEKEAIGKQAAFIRKYEDRIRKQKQRELESSIESRQKKKITEKRRENKKSKPKHDPLYIHGDHCEHIDKLNYFTGAEVVTACERCSREKKWPVLEWRRHIESSGQISSLINPNPLIFYF